MVEEITTGLQGRGVDVYKTYKAAIEGKKEYQHMRDTAADFTAQCFEHAKRMGAAVGIEPTAPRAARVQRNRANAPAENPEEAYKRNLVIPLLDHILSEMEARFQSVSASAGVPCALLTSVLSTGEDVDLSNVHETYGDDMPSPKLLDIEMAR